MAQPKQKPMHPELRKMWEDYFDKCFRESSEPVPENFMDALKFDVVMREWVGLTNDEVNNLAAGCHLGKSVQGAIYEAEAKLKEKNNG